MPSLLPILSYDVPPNSGRQETISTVCEKQDPRGAEGHIKAQSMAEATKLMNTAVYAVQMAMYNGLKSSSQLKAATCLLTQHEYADVVSERSIIKQCGYPLCANTLKLDKSRKGRYHISLREHKVYDLQETRLYCSHDCVAASKRYSACLQSSRDGILEHDKLEDIISCVRGLNVSTQVPEADSLSSEGLSLYERTGDAVSEDFEATDTMEGYAARKYGTLPALREDDDSPVRKGAHQLPKAPKLKSAMKQSPRKHQRISWADEKGGALKGDESFSFATAEDISSESFSLSTGAMFSPDTKTEEISEGSFSFSTGTAAVFAPDTKTEDDLSLDEAAKGRLEVAKVVAAALSDAASASSAGDIEPSDAAARSGLSIISSDVKIQEQVAAVAEVQEVVVQEQAIDSEELSEEPDYGSPWYDAPPTAYKKEVSMFGTIWMSLDGWVSAKTLAYIYNKDDAAAEFLHVNDRVEARPAADKVLTAEIMKTMSSCIGRALPEVVQAVEISTPISVLEPAVGHLLRTMTFNEALPPLGTKEWRLITVLFLDALSVHRLPALGAQLASKRALLRKVVSNAGTSEAEYGAYKQLLVPLGRLGGSFSTLAGG